MSEHRNETVDHGGRFEWKELARVLAGVTGLIVLALFAVVLSAEVTQYVRDGVLELGLFWAVFGASLCQGFVIVILAYAFRHAIGETTFRFLGQIEKTSADLEKSNNSLMTKILPSFASPDEREGDLPVHPPIIAQLRRDLTLMEKHLNSYGIVQRGVVTFGDAGGGMLSTFFEDDGLARASIRTIRFMGTGRGVVGPASKSYRFFDHLKDYLAARGTNFPVFERFAIIGCQDSHDQFCSKVLALLLLQWIKEQNQKGHIRVNGQVVFEIVYPHKDVFPALVAMGQQKGLVAVPIGYKDRQDLAFALPLGIQVMSSPIKIGGTAGTVNLSTTISRITEYFDEVFAESGSPETWGLNDDKSVFVGGLNKGVLDPAVNGVTSITTDEKEAAKSILAYARDSGGHAVLSDEDVGDLAKIFIKASRMHDV